MKLRNKDKYSFEIDNQIKELALCVLDNITNMYYEDLIIMAEFLSQNGFICEDGKYIFDSKFKVNSILDKRYPELKEIFDLKKYTR